MPLYEYTCESCQNSHEQLHGIGDTPGPCPACGNERLTKKVSAAAFVLKGGGWFKDGYSSPKPKKPNSSQD